MAQRRQNWDKAGGQLQEEQELDEQEINQRVLSYHQENVSRMLTWVGIGEERALYLGDYRNVVRDLADPSPDDWALVRAAMLHIAHSDNLHLEHNQWLGQEIFASFEKYAHHYLYYLNLDTRRDRPVPQFDPQVMFPNYQMTPREATYYYSRAALAVLVSKNDPDQAIGFFEELNSVVPRIRFYLPGANHSPFLYRELDRLPVLYERVGRFEDALKFTSVSFTHFGWNVHPADVAVCRLNDWLGQLAESGGVSEVERCLDVIYEWMNKASDVDDDERDHLGECPTTTRQFWAWYYGNALGRLTVSRPSLRDSLLNEIEAGEWENCCHVAGVLFETIPESWDEYRQRALKFYNASEIEYGQQGSIPWGAIQPPHLSAQSDLYWAMRVGFAGAHTESVAGPRVSLAGIFDSLEEIKTITSSTAVHVLHAERNTDNLLVDMKNRVMPNDEYWHGLLRERSPALLKILPLPTVEHLVDAFRHDFAKEWDDLQPLLMQVGGVLVPPNIRTENPGLS